ncbi:MAG: SDR family NAD(P)-dependent oxidoreductase, partial [Bryobacteraceae bacterium]
LIHVSSGAGRGVVPYLGMYCASKFALEALADTYRFELKPFGIDSVLVEPGVHKTPILDNLMAPEDHAVLGEYPSDSNYSSRVKAVFDAANASPETPGAREVVETFVQLIESPIGKRPFRSVPTPSIQPLLQGLNAASEELSKTFAQSFNAADLVS